MRESGFTLVEMLAALVAGSMLLVALSWAVRDMTALAARDTGSGGAAELAGVAPALEQLLSGAAPKGFDAGPDRLRAIVAPPQAAGSVGPVRLTLSVRKGSDGAALVAAFEPLRPGVRWPLAARERVLAQGWNEIGFEYVPAAGEEEGADGAPSLITVAFDDGERIRRLSVEPRLNSDGGCVFDPISMECRA